MLPKGWIELTLPGSQPPEKVAVNVQQIVCIRRGSPDVHGSVSVLQFADGKVQGVTESIETVLQRIAENSPPAS
jgi:uncharacterized protein YlzI (FlbEa/FlbD family)